MATKVEELQEQIAAMKSDAETIQKGADAEERQLYEEETNKIEALVEGIEAKENEIADVRAEQAKLRFRETTERLDQPAVRRTLPARPRDAAEEGKHGFANMGDFCAKAWNAFHGGGQDDRLFIGAAVGTGMQQQVGSDGGYLVPPSFAKEVWDGMTTDANNLLSMTDNYQIEGESLSFPANAETSRAAGSRFGGVRGYWLSELDQLTSSLPKIRQVTLTPKQLAVLVYASDKLLRNSQAASQYLTRAATEEINFMVGDSLVNGTGVGQPEGILNSGCTVSVAKETGQDATTIVAENIIKMHARLHPRSQMRAVWLINQDCLPQLHQMQIGVGTGGQLVYMPPNGLADSPFGTIYGRPVIPIEYCPTLGTVGDIILADLGGYAVGTQGGVETGMSIHLKFDFLQTAFRFVFSVDGLSWLNSAITPFKGTNTQSTFVTLATRA